MDSTTVSGTSNLLVQFDALWGDRRYTGRDKVDRRCCPRFEREANAILAHLQRDELPAGVTRQEGSGLIGPSEIVVFHDAFRVALGDADARIDLGREEAAAAALTSSVQAAAAAVSAK